MKCFQKSQILRTLPTALLGGGALCFANQIGANNRFVAAFLLIALAVILYFYTAVFIAGRNWLDFRAAFSGAWIGTIGLAALRLADYQEPWQDRTWLLVGLAYAVFMLGATAGFIVGKKQLPILAQKISQRAKGRLQRHPNRMYWICVVATCIGLACFSANVAIRGYIPCFRSNDQAAYGGFYTKFHIFSVAATGISGLCYYCLSTQKHSVGRKIVLLLCIFYATFLFPILVVSRGAFVTSALSLTTVVFYLHRRKLWVLFVCLGVIFSVYMGTSMLRGYTDAQLQEFFEPSVIAPNQNDPTTAPTAPTEVTETPDATTPPTQAPAPAPDSPGSSTPSRVFQLSPKMSFLYSYLTVSHDNFNEAVQNTKNFTYGARQFAPFNVIVRSARLTQIVQDAESHLVRPHLNTTNLIGDFYYDFGSLGVVFCMLLWAFIFGVIQSSCDVFEGPFAFLLTGCTLTPAVLCFFATWLSVFSHWMHWGVVLLLALAAYITIKPKK